MKEVVKIFFNGNYHITKSRLKCLRTWNRHLLEVLQMFKKILYNKKNVAGVDLYIDWPYAYILLLRYYLYIS